MELYNPKKVQNDENDCNHQQSMYPITGLRDALTDVPAEKAEHPQDDKNDDDSPQHEISPFEYL